MKFKKQPILEALIYYIISTSLIFWPLSATAATASSGSTCAMGITKSDFIPPLPLESANLLKFK